MLKKFSEAFPGVFLAPKAQKIVAFVEQDPLTWEVMSDLWARIERPEEFLAMEERLMTFGTDGAKWCHPVLAAMADRARQLTAVQPNYMDTFGQYYKLRLAHGDKPLSPVFFDLVGAYESRTKKREEIERRVRWYRDAFSDLGEVDFYFVVLSTAASHLPMLSLSLLAYDEYSNFEERTTQEDYVIRSWRGPRYSLQEAQELLLRYTSAREDEWLCEEMFSAAVQKLRGLGCLLAPE